MAVGRATARQDETAVALIATAAFLVQSMISVTRDRMKTPEVVQSSCFESSRSAFSSASLAWTTNRSALALSSFRRT